MSKKQPRPGSDAWFEEVEASYKAIGDRALVKMGLKPAPEPAVPRPKLAVVGGGRVSIDAFRRAAQRQLAELAEQEQEQAILISGLVDVELRQAALAAHSHAARSREFAERKIRKAWSKIGVELA